ncbi:molybdate transport system substrate-binding protein [Tistlia consotensis]|uniref:Molybdate transport system substrate-binding protein n=1 Tax=Tistlia consotensis USBA 355 TaxID=560819 RepID=A0A1Y6BIC6_9PROT|nr:molybdate ABC transporter substrate-binding protein [Tistlia consotensis]SMF05238.1 molybdate transport system substrate-binding protein [Tistlia consotensis USBA 355]SNR55152.1 molybdate transport system substrate-binding protein [Tistlia consotensis]
MKRLSIRSLSLLLAALAFAIAFTSGFASGSAHAEKLTVFAAASTTDALKRIAALYEARTGDEIVPVFASSSTLAKQIAAAAPVDLFISANPQWMDYLEKQGRLVAGSRHDLLRNGLVLVVPKDSPITGRGNDPVAVLKGLPADARIALGDPSHVPAGIYAKQALSNLGLWDAFRSRIAPGSDVRAALALVAQGETPAGIVYSTDAAIAPGVRAVASFPLDSHEPIVYPAALIDGGKLEAGRHFLDFLGGPEARKVFDELGFGLAEAPRPAS